MYMYGAHVKLKKTSRFLSDLKNMNIDDCAFAVPVLLYVATCMWVPCGYPCMCTVEHCWIHVQTFISTCTYMYRYRYRVFK